MIIQQSLEGEDISHLLPWDPIHFCWTSDRQRCVVPREHSFGHPGQPPGYVARSHCLFCPKCERVWAHLRLIGQDGKHAACTWPVAQSCAQCQVITPWLPVPGSLLVEEGWGVIDLELLWALPEPLLRREFDLHLKAYSK